MPVSYFDSNSIGDIISKMSYDIDTINTSLSSDVIAICTSVITVTGSMTMMLSIAPILVLVFVITIPISLLFTRFMLKRTHKLFKARSQTLGDLNGYIEEMVTGNKTIRAYGKEEDVIKDFDKLNVIATDAAYNAEYYGSITGPGVNFVNNLSLSLICVFGSILYIFKKLLIGDVSSFILYSRRFSGPINEVANIFVDIQSALAASERVFGLIDAEPELKDKEEAIELKEVVGEVKFKNVKFGYLKEKTIIHDLSFKAEPGKVIAIVGPTGAGKTTIVNLLMRFYDIDEGNIYLDSNDIYSIKRKDLRKAYAMVLQDTWLFQASVFENLSYSREDITLNDVIRVCKIARIHHFIERLPNGYDTILSEGGVNISKGQRQLLTIARAMLLDAKMLILDEASSNVDTRTEIKIQEAMKKLMENKTCFIIAHRLSTIQNADLILVVKDGNIVEQGNHEELLAKKGFYNELYYSQFQ
jgi:ATP-binding cassette subfamily B protein